MINSLRQTQGPTEGKGKRLTSVWKMSGFHRGGNEVILELSPMGEKCFLRTKGAGVRKWEERTACGLREHDLVRRMKQWLTTLTLEITRARHLNLGWFLQGKQFVIRKVTLEAAWRMMWVSAIERWIYWCLCSMSSCSGFCFFFCLLVCG